MKMDPFIEAEEAAGHSVKRCCELFEVSRAAYYQRRTACPRPRELSDAELTEQIRRGARRVQGHLRVAAGDQGSCARQGVACGRRRVRRLMRHAGLEGRAKKRWRTTTIPDPDVERAQDLIQRDFGPCTEIDRRYVGDITYIATWEGWAYLATVIDLASRKVVGWALADHMRTELVIDALESAFTTRRPPPGAIFHSDRGCQYTSIDYADLARANGVVLSVGRTGQCWDNAVAESFFATIKRELIDTRAWPTRAGLRAAIFDYIEGWYNTRRLHSSLGYLSPAEYEATIHHHADRSGGMINTPKLSVEPGQAQPARSNEERTLMDHNTPHTPHNPRRWRALALLMASGIAATSWATPAHAARGDGKIQLFDLNWGHDKLYGGSGNDLVRRGRRHRPPARGQRPRHTPRLRRPRPALRPLGEQRPAVGRRRARLPPVHRHAGVPGRRHRARLDRRGRVRQRPQRHPQLV